MKNYDCDPCQTSVHTLCDAKACSCGETDHMYPINAPQRLYEGVTSTLLDSDTSPFAKANQAVILIASTMALDAPETSPDIDLGEIALALQERGWNHVA